MSMVKLLHIWSTEITTDRLHEDLCFVHQKFVHTVWNDSYVHKVETWHGPRYCIAQLN